MTSRHAFRGLLRLPLDPLLLPLLIAELVAHRSAYFGGERLTRIRYELVDRAAPATADLVSERIALTVWVLVLFFGLPAVVRRNMMRSRGVPTRDDLPFDRPFHRDWLFWFLLLPLVYAALRAVPMPREQSSSYGYDRPLTQTFTVDHSWWVSLLGLGLLLLGLFLYGALLGLVRHAYRRLGDPRPLLARRFRPREVEPAPAPSD